MVGKYKGYPEYKDSGVEWLGLVPIDWDVTKLKYTVSIFGRIGFRGYTVNDIVDEGEGAIVLSPSNVNDDQFTLEKKSYLSWVKYYESPEIMVANGDVLMVKTGSTFGKSTIVKNVDKPMTINPQMALMKSSKIDPRFLSYLLNSNLIKAKIDVSNTGSGMPTMTQENMNGFPVPRPSDELAEKIANFLDHETDKIDTLIDKQQQLIQLLKEKRQAVISHAVTKGLNPKAPMRDSGVEWLGEVPEHWDIMPLKHAVTFQRGHDLPAQNRTAGDVPLVTSAGISSTHNIAIAKAPGLVTGRYGTIGKFNLLEEDYWPLNTTLYSINLRGNNPKYLWYMLHNLAPIFIANSLKSAVPGVDRNDLHVVTVAITKDSDEQKALCDYLDKMNQKYDSVTKKALKFITHLKERRTALISAAVTGKIDVRHPVCHPAGDLQSSKSTVHGDL